MVHNKIGLRAKANFPTVLLTLLSIMQALALELMWGYLTDQPYLYSWSMSSVIGWLQIGSTLLGILLIWLIYSGLVMRFSWVPTTADSIFPFVVGIVEFVQISSLGPTKIGPWFLVLSFLFALMSWVSQVTMRRARLDGDNDDFFNGLQPARGRDIAFSMIPAVILAVVGIYLWWSNNQGWIALTALVAATALIAIQLRMNHIFIQRSYQRLEKDLNE